MPPKLSELSTEPRQHVDCCASLSSTLLANITSHIPREDSFVASIGCGSGLLEALILEHRPTLHILGVEVVSCAVRYLPKESVEVVDGSRTLSKKAVEADVWLFVYPRTTTLVEAYVKMAEASPVRTIIWIGPTEDWTDFAPLFESTTFDVDQIAHNTGLGTYELMVVMTKKLSLMRGSMREDVDSHAHDIDDI